MPTLQIIPAVSAFFVPGKAATQAAGDERFAS